jgi:hypothetical protein
MQAAPCRRSPALTHDLRQCLMTFAWCDIRDVPARRDLGTIPVDWTLQRRHLIRDIALLLLLAAASIAVNGYHSGFQDSATYLPAIKHWLNPSLYPWDAIFFLCLTRYSLFVPLVAESSRLSGLSVDAAVFLWHFISIFLVLLACRSLARLIFPEPRAQWGAILLVWGALLLPVAGTALSLTDRYLHPRDLACACIVFALVAAFEKRLAAAPWLLAAAMMHPTMAVYGAFHVAVQAWKLPRKAAAATILPFMVPAAAFSWFGKRDPAWYGVVLGRQHLYPLQHWHWYEWVGVLAPFLLLEFFRSIARHEGNALAAHVARRAVVAGVLGTLAAVVVTTIPGLIPLVPLEPMRILQMVYVLFVLLAGGLIGKYLLQNHQTRWVALILVLAGAFYAADRVVCPASAHIEWPGRAPQNAWLKAFLWIRGNTPKDALFALDPYYMEHRGEDVHGFRGWAERSTLADWTKDRGNVQINADMAFDWYQEFSAIQYWHDFRAEDFTRLKQRFRVDWVVLEQHTPPPAGLDCPYNQDGLLVCSIK